MTKKQIKSTLLGAYLAVGADALKRERVIERIRMRIESMGNLEFNHDIFDGGTASGRSIVDACNTLPFASELRLVEVSNVEKLKKSDKECIISYLVAPAPSTVLLLTAQNLAKNTRLYKQVAALGTSAIIDCTPLKRSQLVGAIRTMAVGYGFTITHAAAEKLIEYVGEDTIRIDAELKKISLAHRGSDAVNEKEITDLVARTAEVKPWSFVDAFSARDAARCVYLYPHLSSESPFSLLAWCTTRIRELICAKALVARNTSGEIASALSLPAWRVKHHTKWARFFEMEELTDALSTARDVERAMKSGANPRDTFMDWVLSICTGHHEHGIPNH